MTETDRLKRACRAAREATEARARWLRCRESRENKRVMLERERVLAAALADVEGIL